MTNLALSLNTHTFKGNLCFVVALIGTLALAWFGITFNQAMALLLAAIVLTIWTYDRANGIIAGLIFFFVKPLLVRIDYAADLSVAGRGGFDLLGITPAILLSVLIIWQLFIRVSSGEKVLIGRTRIWLALFCGLSFLSIFNPINSVIVGFGGFERNILPNVMILLTSSFVFHNELHSTKFMKAMIVVGMLSCIYAIGQYILGVYPWEKDWLLNVAFSDSSAGWLVIGLRGVEFRLFSFFYNYMDFTFCNVIIFALVVAMRSSLDIKWKRVSVWYVVLWFLVLLVTLERTPLIMCFAAMAVIYFLKSDRVKRKKIFWKSTLLGGAFLLSVTLAAPLLNHTGAQKLMRLAELANPFSAASIKDRALRKWEPTLNTISANPLGVGIGYGSQTRANSIAEETDLWVEPHNELLQKTLETGVVGGFVFLLLLISVYRDALKLSHSDDRIKKLGYGFAGATVAFWLCGLVNVPFSGSSGLLYWALAGIVLGVLEKSKKTERTADISNS